jgi:hypothetical protein
VVSEASLVARTDEFIDGQRDLFASTHECTTDLSLAKEPLIAIPIAPILTTGSVRVEK